MHAFFGYSFCSLCLPVRGIRHPLTLRALRLLPFTLFVVPVDCPGLRLRT
jgi:hypothetical protein